MIFIAYSIGADKVKGKELGWTPEAGGGNAYV